MKRYLLIVFLLITADIISDEYRNHYTIPEKGIVATDGLRLRSGSNLKSEVLKTIFSGQEFSVKAISAKFEEIDGIKSFWVQVEVGDQIGWLFGGYCLFNYIKIENTFIGINISATDYEELPWDGIIVPNIKTKIDSYKKNEKSSTTILNTNSDIEAFINIKHSIKFNGCIEIVSNYKEFHTMPHDFYFTRIYKLKNNYIDTKQVFTYFNKVGIQDEPFAELSELIVEENSIVAIYEYYDSIGFPEAGHGNFNLIYYDLGNGYKFNEILSQVKVTMNNEKRTMELDLSTINSKFSWTKLKFIFNE